MSARRDEPLPPLPEGIGKGLPSFPPSIPDRGDLDWRSRSLDDGYRYAEAADAGASLARAALARARGREAVRAPVGRATVERESLADVMRRRPPTGRRASARGIPAFFDPGEDVPIGDEPPEEDWL